MKKEFIPYEQALALKELGFDELCFAMWTTGLTEFESSNASPARIFSSKFKLNDKQSCTSYVNNLKHFGISAPLYQQAFRWFREKYNVSHLIIQTTNKYNICNNEYQYGICKNKKKPFYYDIYNTYEKAEFECLKKLIELCKNN